MVLPRGACTRIQISLRRLPCLWSRCSAPRPVRLPALLWAGSTVGCASSAESFSAGAFLRVSRRPLRRVPCSLLMQCYRLTSHLAPPTCLERLCSAVGGALVVPCEGWLGSFVSSSGPTSPVIRSVMSRTAHALGRSSALTVCQLNSIFSFCLCMRSLQGCAAWYLLPAAAHRHFKHT